MKKVLVASLVPYAKNTRTHSPEQINKIAASITEFGWTNPILIDGDNNIIAGHGRILAAKQLGITEVPAIDLSHLTATQRRAYIIADNQLALESGWDNNLLALELDELDKLDFKLDILGFDEDEINKIINQSEVLKEITIQLKPIKKTRILISIENNSSINIDSIINQLLDAGCEVDYSGN